jgi:hypothetical protein
MLSNTQLQIIGNLSYNNRQREDNIKSFVTLGHYFNYNIAICLANTYCIKGKPSLNSDAMAGYARRYVDSQGRVVLESMNILHSDHLSCTMVFVRADERRAAVKRAEQLNQPLYMALQQTNDPTTTKMLLDAITANNEHANKAGVHTHTFTWEDAKKRGLDKQSAWIRMPKNMLQKRCQSAGLRETLPDIIGVTYTPDELAEVMIDDADERDAIVYASVFQEQAPKELPAPSHQPQPKTAPPPIPAKPNPYPRQFESTKTTADEILLDLDKMDEDKINEVAQEIKVYLFDVQLHQDAREHVTQSCNRLKHKAFQCTIDIARKAMRQDANMSVLDQVKEYIVFGDPTDWSLHDQIFQMYT